MTRKLLLLSALLVSYGTFPAAGQSLQPKSIQFKGAAEYTDAELCTAAELRKGQTLTSAQLNDHMKLLIDSGMFQDISFNYNGQDLVFQIVPVKQLFPIRLENMPVTLATGLEDRLRSRVPLYHGKVPSSGAMLDAIEKELEEELGASGVKGKVDFIPMTNLSTGQTMAISFAIREPNVVVGRFN